jgi:hypothetical protein
MRRVLLGNSDIKTKAETLLSGPWFLAQYSIQLDYMTLQHPSLPADCGL